ncbi:aspartate aminotransferase family protein [Beijerinckia sp. L45]|uniref:aspartate aminotransferase family protein n=1 Tax=Beijerinckia sp. L45 TaxID=1641855 RepID=UPI00131C54F9|nr:aspartate aminotransferase family protein [Beijerinckia sp. L45]
MNRSASAPNDTTTFTAHESAVRSYCRRMPQVFARGQNAMVWDEAGTAFIDFFSACGALNYGHNDPAIKQAAVDHLLSDAVLCGLDLHTPAKRGFIDDFQRIILGPRGLDYRLQFPGPTGTNAVEAALKLARKVTGRRRVVAFSKAFHGMSLGALAATENRQARQGAGVPLPHVIRLAYDGDDRSGLPGIDQFEATLQSGSEPPAAFIVETVQGEGGLNVASAPWLQRLAALARRLGAVLIVDDIQAGCGRTGPFFSFEQAGITPDIVCLAKSISGLGLPMALVLIKPEFDVWAPGEHNGTFRGNTLAFATASAALRFWDQSAFHARKCGNEQIVRAWLDRMHQMFGSFGVTPCGRGLMAGLRFGEAAQADAVARAVFERNMLIETAGPHDEVLKLMPPLTIERETLVEGLERITDAISSVVTPVRVIERVAA